MSSILEKKLSHTIRSSRVPKVRCLIQKFCLACQYVNQDDQEGLTHKFEKHLQFLKSTSVLDKCTVLSPSSLDKKLGYRCLFKLAVRPGRFERFGIGLFSPGTHQVVERMGSCVVHTQALMYLYEDISALFNASTLYPYDEERRTGDIRYLVARSHHLTGELMLTVVATRDVSAEIKKLSMDLRRRNHKLQSVFININTSTGNEIFGPETKHVLGSDALRESVAGIQIDIPPTAFFQINPWQAEVLYQRIKQHLESTRDGVVWDFYCGIGTLSLMLAQVGRAVLGVEENAQAVTWAAKNLYKNQEIKTIPKDAKAEFIAAKVEEVEKLLPTWADSPAAILVNPSRRGLHEEARNMLAHVCRTKKSKFIYMSCSIETFTRDAEDLKTKGLILKQLEAFDMFPYTDKLEWLGIFEPLSN